LRRFYALEQIKSGNKIAGIALAVSIMALSLPLPSMAEEFDNLTLSIEGSATEISQ
jgi:uncharacterized membrane protein YjfL (UPF0719 family)